MSTERDKLAEEYETEKYRTAPAVYSADTIINAFKAGWDARDEEVRRLKNQLDIAVEAMEIAIGQMPGDKNARELQKARIQIRALSQGEE